MSGFDIFVQAVGVIGILMSILSFQCRRHSAILTFKTLNEVFFAIQYALLGAYSGLAMNIVGCVRNVTFAGMVKRGKSTVLGQVIFSALFLVFTAFTWAGWKSVLTGVAKVLSTVAYGTSNTRVMRVIILCTSVCWLTYNAMVLSYAGVINEGLTIVSVLVGIFRFDIWERHHAKAEAMADVED